MKRGYYELAPFQRVGVRCQLVNSGQPTPEQPAYRLTFVAGACRSTLGQGHSITWAASAPDTENSYTRSNTPRQATQKTALVIQVVL